ncbi:MAG TPA: hypothetical protein VGK18_00845 [Propionicimonas sp.]|uniref:hypothetical protein n=1 Tax=Propionicimonas sp. TaxID=1955623 RepID=UPI002F4277D5
MSVDQPVEAKAARRLLDERQPPPEAALEPAPEAPIATVVAPPPLVIGVPINPRTGEPRRPFVIVAAGVLCWLAVAITAASVLWVYWDAVSRFAEASWLMGQFVTEKGSLERVLLAVAVTVVAIIIGTANAIVGWYALTGYRWTRIAGLISAVLTVGALVLNQLGWYAIPAAVIGAALLWLPQAKNFFIAWTARRHPQQVFAPPTVDVSYGPLPRYRTD